MNKVLPSALFILVALFFSSHDVLSQSLGYSGGLCAGSYIDIYIMGGYPCGSANVSSQSNWYVSPAPSSITYNYNNGYYNSIRVKWNSAVSAVVRATYSCSDDGSYGTTANLNLTINSTVTPSVSLSLNTTNVCYGGGSITMTASPTSGGGSPSYNYYVDGVSVYSGSSGTYTYSTSSLAAGSHSAYVTMYSSYPCVTSSSATSTSQNFTVTSKSTYSASISGPGLICSGTSTITLYATITGGVGNLSYEWYVNGAPSWGGSSLTTNATNGNTIYCKVYSDYWCVNSPVQTNTYTVNVTNTVAPTVSVQISPKLNFCPGENITFTASSSYINGSSTYSWYLNGNLVSVPNTSQSIVIPSSSSNMAGHYYPGSTVSVTVNGLSGTCLSSNAATGSTSAAGVYTLPDASAPNQSICSGTTTSINITNPNGISGTTYTWTASSTNATGASNGSGAIIQQPLASANGSSNGTVTYTITPSANGCAGTPVTATVTVKPVPNAAGGNQTICSGQTSSISLTNPNGVSGTTFSWTASHANATGGSSGSGSTIAQPLNATSSSNGAVTYTVTPAADGCSGTPIYPVVTVKPLPSAAASSQSICSGQSTSITITNPNGVSGTTFSWTAAHVNASGGTGGSGSSIAQQLTATASINGSVTYTITPSANGCAGSSISPIATVKPLPNASASSNHYLFSGSATSIAITNPNGVSGTSFNWTVSSSNTSGASSGSGSMIQQVLTSVNGGTATYTIAPMANGCNGTSVTSVATVYAKPVITSTAARVTFESVILSTGSGYDSYTWKNQSNTILGSGQSLNTATPDEYIVTVTKMGATGISVPFILGEQFSDLDENYIVTYNALEDGITAGTVLESLPIEKIAQSVEYFDGLGRPLQTVVTKGSPLRNDIVQPKSYDAFGRELRQYLPYASGTDGWLKTQLFNAVGNYEGIPRNFYNAAVKVAHDTIRPFSETVFEHSPLNRPLKNYGPGEDWFGNDKYVGSSYQVNVDGNALAGQEKIINWTITQTTISNVIYDLVVQTGYWPSNSLHIKITTDEDNHQVREYTDKLGRVVVRKVLSSSPATTYDDTKWAITYYVYDDFNRLRIVLQPEFSNKISAYNAATTTNKNTYLSDWAFRYSYDKRGRMATKQVPGAGVVYMIYDDRDRLVLTQDTKQRSTTPQYWTFTKYDELNRPILTGIKDTSTSPVLTQLQMQGVVDAFYNEALPTFGERYVGNAPGNIHGYSNLAYPVYTSAGTTDLNHYLTVTYYDRYDFRDGWTDEFDHTNEALSETRNDKLYQQPAAEFLRTKGQVTGNKVKVMDGGVRGGYIWLNGINYYDDRYRVIQNVSSNFIGGTDRTTTLFDFAGKVLKVETKHSTGLVTWKDIVGSALSGNKLYKSISGNGWGTAGAASVEQLPAGQDGWVEFTASETNTQRMVGLSDQNTNAQYTSIDFAFYLNTTGLYVFENGANKATIAGGYKGTDRLRIRRAGTTIQYYRNNDLVYTSTTPSSSLLMADVAFNHSNATAINGRSSFSTHSDSITRRFEYDHAGRLLRTWHQLNAEPEILLAYNDYNELGQLIDKKLHSTASTATDTRQSVDYRYNIRGWMTRMNESDLSVDDAGDPYDYFGFEVGYNDDLGLGNGSLYNGNISAMKWSSNLGLADSKMNGYVYSYDLMNRITDATFKVGTGSINSLAWATPSGNAFSETGYTYDLNGNIKTLTRKGAGGVSIDTLNYEYQTPGNTLTHSNRLLKVTDAGDDTKGFTELNTPDNDYVYDSNGNMTWDRNKGGEELLSNGEFSNGNTGWIVTDTGGRLTFANDTLKIALSSAAATLAQNNIIQPNMGYVVIVDMEKTSVTGSLTVNVGGTNVTVSNTGKSILNVTAGTGKNVTVTFPANAFSGNINSIEVKGLVVVAYNFLNLPEKVTKGGDHYMNYYYDAAGRKLTQEVFTSANILEKRSDYAGEYFYENDTLKFIQHEEGRTVMLDGGAEYQYHLKDHLGNVRLTFTTKNEVEKTTATLETDSAATEQSQYLRYENVRRVQSSLFDHTNGTTTGYSQRLNGSANEKFGLARSLSVMPGDTVRAEVFAKYVDQDDGNWTQALADFMAAVANGTAPAGTVIDGGGYSLSTSSFSFAGLLNTSGSSGVGPKAYLNYLVFDRDYNFILAKTGYQRLSDSPKERGQDVAHERLYTEIPITEAGYVYIYLSNENESIVEVFFDDFNVEHAMSPIVQMDNYYPFGLTFNSYRRANSIENRYLYNQGAGEKTFNTERVFDLGLNVDLTRYRVYDPAIGKWWQIDPLADHEDLVKWSPYNYGLNNPIRYSDPEGDFIGTLIGTVVGGAAGAINAYRNGEDVLAGATEGAVSGAIAGAIIDATVATGGGALVVVAAATAGGALGNAVGDLAGQVVSNVKSNGGDLSKAVKNVNFENTGKKALTGAVTGAIGGSVAAGVGKVLGVAANSTKAVQSTMSQNITETAKALTKMGASSQTTQTAMDKITKGMGSAGMNTANAIAKTEATTAMATESALKTAEALNDNKPSTSTRK